MAPLRVVLAGTPQFAVPSLRALLQGPEVVVGVLTQPDRPAGRGRSLQASPVKQVALEAGLPLAQPSSLSAPQDRAALMEWAPDLMVVVAYGLILPRAVLDIPRLGCLNVHASLLPAYRGAAPIPRAILDGCSETGITILEMTEGLDSGPILLQRQRPIRKRETTQDLQEVLAELGAVALGEAIKGVKEGSLTSEPQDPEWASYAPKLHKSEAKLAWERDTNALDRAIRAFNPWPVAFTHCKGQILRIWRARPGEATHLEAGMVSLIAGSLPAVACGDGGSLILEEVQPVGRNRMSGEEAVRGGYILPGEHLGQGSSSGINHDLGKRPLGGKGSADRRKGENSGMG